MQMRNRFEGSNYTASWRRTLGEGGDTKTQNKRRVAELCPSLTSFAAESEINENENGPHLYFRSPARMDEGGEGYKCPANGIDESRH